MSRTVMTIKHRPLTEEQAETLNSVWDEVQDIIADQIHRKKLWRVLDEIMLDAITRTTAAVSHYRLTTPEAIKDRAKSCALDAIRFAARGWRNTLEFFRDVSSNNYGLGTHNGAPVTSFRGSAPVAPIDRRISPRHFRPELFYAAVSIHDEQPILQFASYGSEFIQ